MPSPWKQILNLFYIFIFLRRDKPFLKPSHFLPANSLVQRADYSKHITEEQSEGSISLSWIEQTSTTAQDLPR